MSTGRFHRVHHSQTCLITGHVPNATARRWILWYLRMLSAKINQFIESQLENAYNEIQQERMQDVPILNDKLHVKAVGFRPHEGDWLGVMVTPWFMNLMLLPGDDSDWSHIQELESYTHIFPSGRYSFIAGHEASIGQYQSCSLFSPMFEFADQEAAEKTAEAVMTELMNEENVDSGDIHQQEVESIWNGDSTVEDEATSETPAATNTDDNAADTSPPPPRLSEKMKRPMSRRDLIRGRFLRDDLDT